MSNFNLIAVGQTVQEGYSAEKRGKNCENCIKRIVKIVPFAISRH